MRRSFMTWTLALFIALFVPGCAEDTPPAEEAATAPDADAAAPDAGATSVAAVDGLLSDHMAAEAMLTAHFVAAAVKAGMSTEEINGVLAAVADGSAISEFWVSDETGRVVYTNLPGTEFAFPTDPEASSQSAAFAVLLTGGQAVVDQDFMPRELDGMVFKYVGAAGVDQARIVQVGVAAPADSAAP
ncbi:MAG: hypothetical protein F4014_14850 [Gemmatimonadetes bacterium]|nr:hypothetical protein [Gemmatimonadota bacterium]MYL00015.1 hypothetical protein [Gemmatimonadota bacterium]